MKDCKRGIAKHAENQAWVDIASESPDCSGVYTVWRGVQCLYVGSSQSIRRRLLQSGHAKKFLGIKPDSIVIMCCDDFKAKEADLIAHLGPALNVWRPKKDFELKEEYVCAACKKEKIAGLFLPSSIRMGRPVCIACNRINNQKSHPRLPDGVPTHAWHKDPTRPPVLFGKEYRERAA